MTMINKAFREGAHSRCASQREQAVGALESLHAESNRSPGCGNR